ncbi:MAG: PQQ-binding-like beta-propeller repeat protein, partial [Acidimicrobiales bacterium]|nr:PQQ-binding-like beta-propeller repeat protein [Acidimicrobiales bacterium]
MAILALVVAGAWFFGRGDDGDNSSGPGSDHAATGTTVAPATTAGLAPEPTTPYAGWVDPASSGKPWSSKVLGQLTFRGNPTRTYYGLGPVPKHPKVLWQYPESGGMCGNSPVGGANKVWCGSGWTGQPSVWKDGSKTWVAVGTYDKNIHFFDGITGDNLLEPFDMGDIIKGSVTRDPDGYPLLYSGSRADFHILATDRDDGKPESLWTMRASDVKPTKWNDDWDSSPLVIDDYLFEGGENGQWFVIKLNRGKGPDGKVTVDPKIVFHAPGWDDRLLSDLSGSGSRVNDVSIENSLAISGNTVYFSNSGGLVQGWDISGVKEGKEPKRVFRYWTGDDTDASIVVDPEGKLYVAQEVERGSSSSRNHEVGQLIKLDPSKPDDPRVWGIADDHGIWATPALSGGVVIAPTDSGRIIGADQRTGEILWEKKLPGPTWSSPVVVDKVWVQGDCNGVLHGFDFSNPRVEPPELWSVELEGCVESTPTVFQGRIYVGARGGKFYAIGD